MDIPGGTISSVMGIAVTGILSFFLGRRQEVEKLRLTHAFPLAEKAAVLFQDVRDRDVDLRDWYRGNFEPQLNLNGAMERFNTRADFESDRKRVHELLDRRHELHELLKVGRVYLNPWILDYIQEYLSVSSFRFMDDGLGGVLFHTMYWEFFKNLLDKQKDSKRAALFKEIRPGLNRLHSIHRLSWRLPEVAMNRQQIRAMWAGVAAIVLMGLYPPWLTDSSFAEPSHYTWLWAGATSIDWERLQVGWLLVGLITVAAVATLRKPKELSDVTGSSSKPDPKIPEHEDPLG